MYRPSPLFASAFPILSVAEAAKEVASSAELKAQAVKSKALEAAGEKPTGANLYARSVPCASEHLLFLWTDVGSVQRRGERRV